LNVHFQVLVENNAKVDKMKLLEVVNEKVDDEKKKKALAAKGVSLDGRKKCAKILERIVIKKAAAVNAAAQTETNANEQEDFVKAKPIKMRDRCTA
jgi:hypothetical protein